MKIRIKIKIRIKNKIRIKIKIRTKIKIRIITESKSRSKSMMGQEQKKIIIVCKDAKDWIGPKTDVPFAGFEKGDKNMITLKIYSHSKIVYLFLMIWVIKLIRI